MTQLPAVGLGSAALGGLYTPIDDREAVDTLTSAFAQGIRYFDTAPFYGCGDGERRLGLALADMPAADVIVSNKVGRLLEAEGSDPRDFLWAIPGRLRTRFDFSAAGVLRSLAESRQRVGREFFDILFIHDPENDPEPALEEAYPALDELRSRGEIGRLGVGSCDLDAHLPFLSRARLDCILLAGRYTLLDHERALSDLLPLCESKGVAVIAGGVFNSGILAGSDRFDYVEAPAGVTERARQMAAVCARHNVPLKAAALQFTAAHPAVTTVLCGSRTGAELAECLAGFEVEIPTALWDELKERGLISPEAPTRPRVYMDGPSRGMPKSR